MRRAQTAGTMRQLLNVNGELARQWAEANPDWLGKHWGMWLGLAGTTLGPINIEGGAR